MSRQKKSYPATFKAQVVLELLRGDKTLNEFAELYQIAPATLSAWAQGLSGTGAYDLPARPYDTGQGNQSSERGDRGSPKESLSTHD